MSTFSINTQAKQELVDITPQVAQAVADSGISDGLCHLWCHHTTAGLTVNENADPDVKRDLLMALSKIVNDGWSYRHLEGNSPSHIKSSLIGCQLSVPLQTGKLSLGTWQGILFAEFDGPRQGRKVTVTVIPRR
jgi:secondary thiamine-phosphate synthase enzyme